MRATTAAALFTPELPPWEVALRAASDVHEKGGERLEDVKDAFLERSGKVTVVLR